MRQMLVIDGSYGEGGGQIVRLSVSLSAITGIPVKVINIRAKRKNPGLSYQHITAINAVKEITNADIDGLKKGSTEITFYPRRCKGGDFEFNIGTAGSITLVLQCCLLPALFSNTITKLRIIGGTDVPFAPPVDYFKNVFLRLLNMMNMYIDMKIITRGFYPRGGGVVEVTITPVEKIIPMMREQQEKITKIEGISFCAGLPSHVVERMKSETIKKLNEYGNYQTNITVEQSTSLSPGGGIVIWTNTLLGSSELAKKGIPAEKIGAVTAEKLITEIQSGATIDIHAADQILVYLAFASGKSIFLCRELTNHTKTMLWLISQFVNTKFNLSQLRYSDTQKLLHKIEVIPEL